MLAPSILLVLFRRPKIGILLNIAVIIFGIFLNVSPKLILNIPSYFEFKNIQTFESLIKSLDYYQMNTTQYVGSFTLGMLTGFFIVKHPKAYVGGSFVEIFLNTISLFSITCMVFWSNMLSAIDGTTTELNMLLYFSFAKFIWSLSFAWLLFVWCTGRSGISQQMFIWYSVWQSSNDLYRILQSIECILEVY